MPPFFPAIQPYAEHHISVDNFHTLYVEESGNSKGIPVVFLHGGPGAGSNENFRRIFDPKIYRIILFDQRGAGRSTPLGELKDNTTEFLLSDMELIRKQLNIEKWVIFGESWGSALGLIYAERFSECVLGLILRGVLLAQQQDIDWFYKSNGVSRIYPEAWESFTHHLTTDERNDILRSYYKRLTSEDKNICYEAVKAFTLYGKACSTLLPNTFEIDANTNMDSLLKSAKIESHYYANNFFIETDFIINNIAKLTNIPGIIIHGRYDMCCSFRNAYLLHQAWQLSQLLIVPDAGHSVLETGYHNNLIDATNSVAKQLS